MATTYYELADLTSATLFNESKGQITNLDPDLLRDYPAALRLVTKKVAYEQGGLDYRWRVNVSGNSSAAYFGAYHTVTRGVNDHIKTASMQLRNLRADFSYDVLEPEFNQGEYEVVDVIKNREQNAKISVTKQIEASFWSYAAVDDELTPQGILYWLPYTSTAATATNQGFTGTVPSGHTTIAGLNPSTYTGWKSQGDVYVAVTDADLFLKMRTSFSRTRFKAPLKTLLIKSHGDMPSHSLYMNLQTIQQFEDAAKAQNDNIGLDLSWSTDRALFHGCELEEVPTLDSNTRDPVIGINWGVCQNRVKRGWWMKTEKVAQNPVQPLTVSYDMYCVSQFIMHDRRTGGFNIAKAA